MLGIFNKMSKKRATATGEKPQRASAFDNEGLARLIPYFPIGHKLLYYPEYKQELTLSTTIIAYAINNELVYSNSDISWKQEGGKTQVYLNGNLLDKISSFCFIMPMASRGEGELDYGRKESLGKDGGFIKGNNITLKVEQREGRLPMLDATVRKQMLLKEGHYVGHQVAILDVDPTKFRLIEQRSHVRLKTAVPGQLQGKSHHIPLSCTMVDFSDRAARIIYHEEAENALPTYREGSQVTLSFDLPESTEARVIRGKVIRQHEDMVVMTLDNIMREKAFEKVDSFDIMEIKANLLQQQQSL